VTVSLAPPPSAGDRVADPRDRPDIPESDGRPILDPPLHHLAAAQLGPSALTPTRGRRVGRFRAPSEAESNGTAQPWVPSGGYPKYAPRESPLILQSKKT